jgi:hypothetical protein
MTRDPRTIVGATVVVVLVWVIGAAVTRFTLTQMAFLAPIGVVVVGATIAVPLLWVKVVREALRDRRSREA